MSVSLRSPSYNMHLKSEQSKIERVAQIIVESKSIVCFTGAGACTDSGVPDFRGIGMSYWTQYDPQDFEFQNFIDSEKSRQIYWKMEQEFYELVQNVRPNAIHDACAELEMYGKLHAIITQNVDRLHQRAGSSHEKMIEIHGNIYTVTCLKCFYQYSREYIYFKIKNGVRVPYCEFCGGILKSDTIAFGQPMPQLQCSQSLMATYHSDLFIVIGSSLLVQPAAYLIVKAKESRSKIILINLMSTPYDHLVDLAIYQNGESVMKGIMELVRKKLT